MPDLFQVDQKLISVQFAKKTAFLKIEGRQIGSRSSVPLGGFVSWWFARPIHHARG